MTNLHIYQIISVGLIVTFALLRTFEVKLRTGANKGVIKNPRSFHLLLASTLAVVLTSILTVLLSNTPTPVSSLLVGTLILLSSFGLRHLAANALGSFWSVHIEIRKDHPVIKTGPYKYIRHPIYTSILLEAAGFAILGNSYCALVLIVLATLPSIIYRLKKEEKAMISEIGAPYEIYMKTTGSLIPKLK